MYFTSKFSVLKALFENVNRFKLSKRPEIALNLESSRYLWNFKYPRWIWWKIWCWKWII